MRHLPLLLVAACTTAPTAMPTAEAPPPGFALEVDPIIPGDTLTLVASGLPQGTTAYFFRGSRVGPGPCAPGGSPCVDVAGGATMIGSARAGAAGRATLTGVVPTSVPFDAEHWFQAMATTGDLSAIVRRSQSDGCSNPAQLAGVDLSHRDLSGMNLGCADLSGADLTGTDLTGADLFDADLSFAWLDGAILDGAHAAWARLDDASATGVSLDGTDLTAATLHRADLRFSSGANTRMRWAVGGDMVLSDTTGLTSLDGRNTIFPNLDLRRSATPSWDIDGADFTGVLADDADLSFLRSVSVSFEGGSFVGTTILNSTLIYARFDQATLREVDLRNSDLRWCEFDDTTFQDVLMLEDLFQYSYWYGTSTLDGVDMRASTFPNLNTAGGRVYQDVICPNGILYPQTGHDCP